MCLTQARYGIAWGAIGAAMACFDEAVSYAKNRIMFDRPIAQTQIQQVRLADMLTEITKAQFLALQLGRLKDAGTMTPEQVSLAKRNNVNMACECAREARRLLGGQRHPGRVSLDAAHGEPRVGLHLRGHARHARPDPGARDHGVAGILGREDVRT